MNYEREGSESVLEFDYSDLGNFLEREDEILDLGYTSSSRLEEMEVFSILDEELGSSDTMVEIGCSYGHTTEMLDSRCDAKIIGLDYFDRWSEYRFIDDTNPQKMKVIEPLLPFKDNSIDFILALNSTGVMAQENMIGKLAKDLVQKAEINCEDINPAEIYTKNYIDTVLREVSRALKQDGLYMISNHLGFGGTQNVLMRKNKDKLTLEDINENKIEDRDIRWLQNSKINIPEQSGLEELKD